MRIKKLPVSGGTAADVLRRLRETLEEAGLDAAGNQVGSESSFEDVVDALVAAVDLLRRALRTAIENDEEHRAVAVALLDLQELLDETRIAAREQLLSAFRGVREALSRLRGLQTVELMLEHGPAELCSRVGFDRAVLFRVHDGAMVAECVYDSTDPERGKRLVETSRENPSLLSHQLIETEMMRRRAPILVSDPMGDPRTDKLLMRASQTRAYVSAPIMPSNRVIGFLHADREDRRVDEIDRDILWSFAEGFGFAAERADLRARLTAQRQKVTSLVGALEGALETIDDTSVELVRSTDDGATAVHRTMTLAAPLSRVDRLLTRRELEVLDILATGASNGRIAQELVVSEATVKSHVKHILRKLRAANRAEAVYRYRQLSDQGS